MIKFVVLESNPERVGGRAHTYEIVVDDDAFHVDLGGTWLHGTEAHPFLVENLVSIDETMPISKTNFWTSRKIFNLERRRNIEPAASGRRRRRVARREGGGASRRAVGPMGDWVRGSSAAWACGGGGARVAV